MNQSAPPALDLRFLWSRAAVKRIGAFALALGMAGAAYAFLAPKWFKATLTVIPAKQQRSGLPSIPGIELASLAMGLDSASADAARISAVLQSISVADAVIDKFGLIDRYDKKYREAARIALWKHCSVTTLTKSGMVQLVCEDKDPEFVKGMLTFFAEYANSVFRRVSVSSATEEVRFLETRVVELRREAQESATRLKDFQEKYKIIDLETQAKAVVSTLATLNAQKVHKQVELDYARRFASVDEPSLKELETQVGVMGHRLKSLEEGPGSPLTPEQPSSTARGTTSLFPAALTVPKLRMEYESIFRDRKVTESALVYALARLEEAKANEARDVSTFVVLDAPVLPTHHSRPKRSLTVLLCLLGGGLLGVAVEWWRSGPGQLALQEGAGAESVRG